VLSWVNAWLHSRSAAVRGDRAHVAEFALSANDDKVPDAGVCEPGRCAVERSCGVVGGDGLVRGVWVGGFAHDDGECAALVEEIFASHKVCGVHLVVVKCGRPRVDSMEGSHPVSTRGLRRSNLQFAARDSHQDSPLIRRWVFCALVMSFVFECAAGKWRLCELDLYGCAYGCTCRW
jgi:hypothetical protein